MDEPWMQLALDEAQKAAQEGEVPVGAVFVVNQEVISQAHNRREIDHNPLGHAEILAIQQSSKKLERWRLGGTLYVTLEPCPMCMGALLQARVERLVFGCADPRGGACGSKLQLNDAAYGWNHELEITAGVLEEECREILQDFFKKLRASSQS